MADLNLRQAATAVGASANSVRTWAKKDSRLRTLVRKNGRRLTFPPAAMKALAEVKDAKYAAAGPALRAAWAARAAGKGAKKKPSRRGPASSPAKTTAAVERSMGPRSRKPAPVVSPPPSIEVLMSGLRTRLERGAHEAQERIRATVRSVLLEQRKLIDRALKDLG